MPGGLVGIFPYVYDTRGCMKPVEHHEGQTHVSQYRPQHLPVEIVAFVEQIVGLDLKSLGYPHRHVTNNEESQKFPSRFLFL